MEFPRCRLPFKNIILKLSGQWSTHCFDLLLLKNVGVDVTGKDMHFYPKANLY